MTSYWLFRLPGLLCLGWCGATVSAVRIDIRSTPFSDGPYRLTYLTQMEVAWSSILEQTRTIYGIWYKFITDTSEPEGNPSPTATAAHTIWNIWPSQKFNRSGQFYTEPVLTGNQLINLGNSEWSSFFHSKQVLSYYGRYVSSWSFSNCNTQGYISGWEDKQCAYRWRRGRHELQQWITRGERRCWG